MNEDASPPMVGCFSTTITGSEWVLIKYPVATPVIPPPRIMWRDMVVGKERVYFINLL